MDASTGFNGGDTAALTAIMAGAVVYMIVALAIAVVMIASLWKIFTKAGRPGWAAIVPIYNVMVLLEMVGRPMWWLVLLIIPFVNIVVGIMITIDLARSFGKDIGFAIGLLVLSVIFYPMLAFGQAQYRGPSVQTV